MSSRRRHIRITREGWSFIFILVFIVIGSILRQINLLVLLTALLTGPLLFNWRIAIAMLRRLTLLRRLPRWSHAGDTVIVEWEIANQKDNLVAWSLKITDRVRQIEPQQGRASPVELLVPQVRPHDTSFVSYRCFFGRRGRYEFGPAVLSTQFPFALVRAWQRLPRPDRFIVGPRLGELQPAWFRQLQSAAVGVRSRMNRRGASHDEFYAIRPWRPGDSLRWIHWRSTAKQGEPMVKQFDQQTDRDLAIVLDLWRPATAPASAAPASAVADDSPAELAVSFVATVVSQLKQKVKGHVAIGLCGNQMTVLRDRLSDSLQGQLMETLAVIEPAADNQLRDCLAAIGRSRPAGAPLYVVSTRPMADALGPESAADQLAVDHSQITAWLVAGSDEFAEWFTSSVADQPPAAVAHRKTTSLATVQPA